MPLGPKPVVPGRFLGFLWHCVSLNNVDALVFRSFTVRELGRLMGIYKRYFDPIVSGSKTIEIRVNDSSRKKIKTGSLIRFRCQDDEILTRVTRITRYPTFEAMLDHEDLASWPASVRSIRPNARHSVSLPSASNWSTRAAP
jgi:ASC-1-like (ASCH) protein